MEGFVEKLATKNGISKKAAKELVSSFIETLTEEIVTNGKITFLGFGTFEKVNKAARKSFNPKEKKIVEYPATVLPKFKAGSKLKQAVKG